MMKRLATVGIAVIALGGALLAAPSAMAAEHRSPGTGASATVNGSGAHPGCRGHRIDCGHDHWNHLWNDGTSTWDDQYWNEYHPWHGLIRDYRHGGDHWDRSGKGRHHGKPPKHRGHKPGHGPKHHGKKPRRGPKHRGNKPGYGPKHRGPKHHGNKPGHGPKYRGPKHRNPKYRGPKYPGYGPKHRGPKHYGKKPGHGPRHRGYKPRYKHHRNKHWRRDHR